LFSAASNTSNHHRFAPISEGVPLWRGGCLDPRYKRTPVAQRHSITFASLQAAQPSLQASSSSAAFIASHSPAVAGRPSSSVTEVRITELLHMVDQETRFKAAFANLRTSERYENPTALLAAILADATNRGAGSVMWC